MIRIEPVPASVVWPLRHEVMYPEKDVDSIKLAGDATAVHLALWEGEELISVISLFRDGDELQFRKFATRQQFQRRGYGSQLLEHTLCYARQHGVYRLWCNARRSAVPFYRKFGFRETAQAFRRNDMDYVVMELLLAER